MGRVVFVSAVAVAAAVFVTSAAAAVFVHLETQRAYPGDVIRVVGDATRMPLYALPLRKLPCAKNNTCSGPIRRAKPPHGPPFTLLGFAPGAHTGMGKPHSFSIDLPRRLRPGKYVVFVWCASCGGSLIMAGSDPQGRPQILHVLR